MNYVIAGEIVILDQIKLDVISTEPPHLVLNCRTIGGPLANTFWTRNDERIVPDNNSTFETETVVLNYTAAVYDHILSVYADAPGTYKFIAENPFVVSGPKFLNSTHYVEGEISKTMAS